MFRRESASMGPTHRAKAFEIKATASDQLTFTGATVKGARTSEACHRLDHTTQDRPDFSSQDDNPW
jgi:hypothetical protein